MYGYTYMEVFTITLRIFHYGFRAEMKFYAGTLTTKHVARLVTLFMRDVCMPPCLPLETNFS